MLQAGLVVALLDRYSEIFFPVYPQYVATFGDIFRNHPCISLYQVPQIKGEDWGSPKEATYVKARAQAGLEFVPELRLGIYAGRGVKWDFSQSFYDHAQIDYEERWRKCPIAQAARATASEALCWSELGIAEDERKIFVHDDLARYFRIWKNIGGAKVFRPADKPADSLLRYATLINTADEIHCIDSVFFHLVDSLNPVGKLYLHCYARWSRYRDFRYRNRFYWHYLF